LRVAHFHSCGGVALLTEQEVSRSWIRLFAGGVEVTVETFTKAETLLEELRPESPLYHRLQNELEEIRELHAPKKTKKKKAQKLKI
jgi:hypothetical protein